MSGPTESSSTENVPPFKLSNPWKNYAERREHGFEIVDRHGLSVQFHVDRSGFAVHIVSAGQFGQRLADGDVALRQFSGLVLQVVLDGEDYLDGTPDGEPLGTSFNDLAVKVPLAFAMWPSELRVPSKSAEPVMPNSGSTSADWERSSFLRFTFACTGVSEVSVGLIGPLVPSMLKLPPPGRPAETSTGKARVKRKIARGNVDLVVHDGFSFAGGGSKRDGSVGQLDFGHVHVRRRAGCFSRTLGGLRRLIAVLVPERRKVPDAIAVAQQCDFGMIDAEVGDVELLAENERHQFDAYLERFRLDKRGAAEPGIVCDRELVGLRHCRRRC